MKGISSKTKLIGGIVLVACLLSSCGGGGGSGGGVSVPAAVSYGAVDGYVYVPYGAAREAGAAVGYRHSNDF